VKVVQMAEEVSSLNTKRLSRIYAMLSVFCIVAYGSVELILKAGSKGISNFHIKLWQLCMYINVVRAMFCITK